jgi:hypothetical protein
MSKMMEALSIWQEQNKETINTLERSRKQAVVKALSFLNAKYGITESPTIKEQEEEFTFEDVDLTGVNLEIDDLSEFDLDGEIELDDLDLEDLSNLDFEIEEEDNYKPYYGDRVEFKDDHTATNGTIIPKGTTGIVLDKVLSDAVILFENNQSFSDKKAIVDISALKQIPKIPLVGLTIFKQDTQTFYHPNDMDSANTYLQENEGLTFEITFVWDNGDIMADEVTVGTQNWGDFNPQKDTIDSYYKKLIQVGRSQGNPFDAKFITVVTQPYESYSFDTLNKPVKRNRT